MYFLALTFELRALLSLIWPSGHMTLKHNKAIKI